MSQDSLEHMAVLLLGLLSAAIIDVSLRSTSLLFLITLKSYCYYCV